MLQQSALRDHTDELGRLPHLQSLELAGNKLTSNIPPELGSLWCLQLLKVLSLFCMSCHLWTLVNDSLMLESLRSRGFEVWIIFATSIYGLGDIRGPI